MKVRQITETKTIKIEDATFTIGMIPRSLWRKIASQLLEFNKLLAPLVNKDIRELAKIGNGLKEASKKIEEQAMAGVNAAEFARANEIFTEAYRDLVRYGIRSHVGIMDAEGREVAFKSDPNGYADESIVELYELNKLITQLGPEVMNFNSLAENDRKN